MELFTELYCVCSFVLVYIFSTAELVVLLMVLYLLDAVFTFCCVLLALYLLPQQR